MISVVNMSSYTDGEGDYKSNLSEKFLEIAKNELGENDTRRSQALAQLRELIKKNENIKNCVLGKIQ